MAQHLSDAVMRRSPICIVHRKSKVQKVLLSVLIKGRGGDICTYAHTCLVKNKMPPEGCIRTSKCITCGKRDGGQKTGLEGDSAVSPFTPLDFELFVCITYSET